MSNLKANRAAQFNPFDSLKGFNEELRAREEKHTRIERKELSEELQEKLELGLSRAVKGTTVEITFYYLGHYVQMVGMVKANCPAYRYITVDETKIFYEDLYEVNMK